MNVGLLEKVKELILAEPEKLNMNHWVAKTSSCGTACCIAGWTCAIERLTPRYSLYTPDVAEGLLGLTKEQSCRLFFADGWPKQFVPKGNDIDDDFDWELVTAEQAAARIDHFIATEGRE